MRTSYGHPGWCPSKTYLICCLFFFESCLVGEIPDLNHISKPQPLKNIVVNYPILAQYEGTGFAEVAFLVDLEGNPTDFVVLQATHPAFGKAIIEAVQKVRFSPARRNGTPESAYLIHRTNFFMERAVMEMMPGEKVERDHSQRRSQSTRISSMSELDSPPKVIEKVVPVYPEELLEQSLTGGVLIEFYLGPDGKVRIPRVISTSHKSFSKAALAAIREWKYEPPLNKGHPVCVLTRQQINFGSVN